MSTDTPKKPSPAIRKRTANKNISRFPSKRPVAPFSSGSASTIRRRTFIQRYLMEFFIFSITLSGSLLYMYLNMEAEHQDLEAHLPQRQRFRLWDWPPLHEMKDVQKQWHHAVVTIILPTEKQGVMEDVTFQSSMGHEHKLGPEDPGHVEMPSFFLDHDVYGIIAWHPADKSIKNISKYNKQAHIDMFNDLTNLAKPLPDEVYEIDVENRNRGLELGWAATYSNMCTKIERDEIESQMLLLGRMYGQVAIYKWWAHQYGPNPRKDVSIIQEILPTAAATWNMRTSGPVYRVRYQKREKPYQVPGEYHHTPRQRLPQYDNTKKNRRRKHIEWVKEEIRLDKIRKEESIKFKQKIKVQKEERRKEEGKGGKEGSSDGNL